MEFLNIAIDGPAGSGKSSIAKILAKELNILYVDTGAMYRAMAYKCIKDNIDLNDSNAVCEHLKNTKLSIDWNEKGNQIILIDEKDVSGQIRTQQVASGASCVAKLHEVREKLVNIQQEIAKNNSLVMDGRDIGTNVLKTANLKIFLTASIEKRAKRRFLELSKLGQETDLLTLAEEIKKRDFEDSNRKISPLKKASDAILIDSSDMSIDEVVQKIKGIISEKRLL